MKVLLVGLSGERMAAASAWFAELGDQVSAVATGAAALDWLESSAPQLILIETPSSAELRAACEAIRSAPRRAEILILAMVGEDDIAALPELLIAGASDFYVSSLGAAGLRARLRIVRHTAERVALRQGAEKEVEQLFRMSLDLLCVAGLDGRFRRVSPSWTETFGWTAEELTSAPWLDFVHPDDLAATVGAGAQLGAGATLISFTNRYRCRDGTYRWLEWRSVPGLEIGLIYASARDVTPQRAQHEELRDLTESLATTLSSIGDGVIAVDAQARVARMNPVAERLTGWLERDAKGRPFVEVVRLVHAETRGPVVDPVARAMGENLAVGFDEPTLLIRRDGSELRIADSCAPIKRRDGVVSGAVLVFRDMTPELAAAELQSKVQRQLVFADRMASVSTLAAGMAHEINNPLAYVAANLEMLVEEIRELGGGSASSRLRDLEEMARDAQQGAERIKKIVRGLKTFSRADEERLTVVDVREVLELSINMTFNEIRHHARLVKDFAEIPSVDADDARLGQVFINLLVNAAHAITGEDATINEIRVTTSTDAAGRAAIEIRDTGGGIPSHLLSRIFDPFFTTKPVGIGTGLGLSICHNIVSGMGGEITVTSVVGKGTTFRVVLPASARTAESSALPSVTPQPHIARAEVLVIDDEPAVGITLGRVLREHSVTVVTRARDALELLYAGRQFDVILSDLMMPEMSGMELYEELTRRAPEAAERIVFISGGAFTAVANAFLDTVPNERIEKPFEASTIRAMVARFVKELPAAKC